MTLAESIAKDVVREMDKPEHERIIALMLNEFLQTMTIEERKEMMAKFIPEIVSRVMEGASSEDRKTAWRPWLRPFSTQSLMAKRRGLIMRGKKLDKPFVLQVEKRTSYGLD